MGFTAPMSRRKKVGTLCCAALIASYCTGEFLAARARSFLPAHPRHGQVHAPGQPPAASRQRADLGHFHDQQSDSCG